jgi:23S rRNA (cytosine1962-C5)-methyltransferase
MSDQSTKPPARLRLRVTAAAETRLRAGHPWLFADSIREQNRAGQGGELAVLYDRNDRFLAVGLFDPDSPIRVRMLHVGKPQTINLSWWTQHLQQALERRRGLFDDQTTGFRYISGENDGWPGLVLDRYDQTLVLKLYTAAWLPRLEEITGLMASPALPLPLGEGRGEGDSVSSPEPSFGPGQRLVLRLSRNIQERARTEFGRSDGQILLGPPLSGPVVFLESGLRFEADVVRGQKTGFFLDQRENRRQVGTLASGRRVLNAFSFSGGFSLYAARAGAASVTDIDISAHALASAGRNFALNQSDATVARCPHEAIQADAFDWLAANPERQFDLIVLDPPSLAKREAERAGAIRAYSRLVSLALGHLAPGGILVACSCSAHVSAEEFFSAVRSALTRSRRPFEEIQTTGHALDHPATFAEAQYLKGIYLRVRN